MRDVVIDGNSLTLDDAVALSLGMANGVVSDDSKRSMYASRLAIEQIIESDDVIYGINTGFGAMSSVRIEGNDLEELQTTLIKSHAC